MGQRPFTAHVTQTTGSSVITLGQDYWRLELPVNSTSTYRLAQLDDHGGLPRDKFLWKPPLTLSLQARLSAEDLPGTWGFGFWNDPFSFLIGGDRTVRRFPTLPNAAWFFHASPQNYLSFRDDLPANGFLAATFRSVRIHPAVLALASPVLGLTLLPAIAQVVRRSLQRVVSQDSLLLHVEVTQWHTYKLDWQPAQVRFSVDEVEMWHTPVAPPSPLCLVIWIDNQYASLPPHGRLRYGSLPNPSPAWLEIREIELLDLD